MGYVYRYIDLADNIIKYVGIVWGATRKLKDRIREEELNFDWIKNSKWRVEYIEDDINTRTDAEYFEAHYISLFETGKYYNKSKSNWGLSSFLPDRDDWKTFKVVNDNFNSVNRGVAMERDTVFSILNIDLINEKIKEFTNKNGYIPFIFYNKKTSELIDNAGREYIIEDYDGSYLNNDLEFGEIEIR